MRKSTSGFTIVELIIVIAVIGIIASIAIVSYSGIRTQTLNAERVAELLEWKTTFAKYKAANGSYPTMPNGGYCLGTGFPDGKCRNYTASTNVYYESDSIALMDALADYDPPEAKTRVPVLGISIGPYTDYLSSTIRLSTAIQGLDCPDGTISSWNDGSSRSVCGIDLVK